MDTETASDLKKILSIIDTDGSGKIDYTEFMASVIDHEIYHREEKLYQAFKKFDIDGSG